MRSGVTVGVAQWLSVPGDVDANVAIALTLIEEAAARGVELLVLPELWSMGYNPATMKADAQRLATPLPGPGIAAIMAAAAQHRMWIHAGSVPERDGELIYNTAPLISPTGEIVAAHRKFKPYFVTGEHEVFASGTGITVYDVPNIGRLGLITCFDGDFHQTSIDLRRAGVEIVLEPAGYDLPGERTWDLWYRAQALANGQFWLMSGQCGVNPSATLLGRSQVISPLGDLLVSAPICDGVATPAPTVIVTTLDLTEEIAHSIEYAHFVDD